MQTFKNLNAKVSLVQNKKADGTLETDKRQAKYLLLVEIEGVKKRLAFTGDRCGIAAARGEKNLEDFKLVQENGLICWIKNLFKG